MLIFFLKVTYFKNTHFYLVEILHSLKYYKIRQYFAFRSSLKMATTTNIKRCLKLNILAQLVKCVKIKNILSPQFQCKYLLFIIQIRDFYASVQILYVFIRGFIPIWKYYALFSRYFISQRNILLLLSFPIYGFRRAQDQPVTTLNRAQFLSDVKPCFIHFYLSGSFTKTFWSKIFDTFSVS